MLEEAAYINPLCFFEVILPLLQLSVVAFIAITTVAGDETNYITELSNKGVFRKLEIILACDVCKRSGKSSGCTHKTGIVPEHIDPARRDLVNLCYGEERKEQADREMFGATTTSQNRCFDTKAVLDLFSKTERRYIEAAPPFVFVAIDPCGGTRNEHGRVSDFAMCTHIGPGMIIIAAEAFYVDNIRTSVPRMLAHFKLIRSHPMLVHSKLVVSIEGNLGNEAGWLREEIQKDNYNVTFLSDHKHIDGVKTNEKNKHRMQLNLDMLLQSKQISISRDFFSTDPNPALVLQKAQNQLLTYSRILIPGRDSFKAPRFKYSGKGLNKKDMDDVAIVIQLAWYWSQMFMFGSQFIDLRR